MAFSCLLLCNYQNISNLNRCFAVFFHPLFVAFCTPLKPKIGQKEPFFWHFPPFYSTKKTEFCNPFVTLLTFINVTLFCHPFCHPFTKKQVAATLREQALQRPLKSNITVIYLYSFRVSGAAIRVFSRNYVRKALLFASGGADGRHRPVSAKASGASLSLCCSQGYAHVRLCRCYPSSSAKILNNSHLAASGRLIFTPPHKARAKKQLPNNPFFRLFESFSLSLLKIPPIIKTQLK